MPSAIAARHADACPARRDRSEKCKCSPSWRASVWTKEGWIQKSFRSKPEATSWYRDAAKLAKDRKLKPPTRRTLTEAVQAFFVGARSNPPTVLARGRRKNSGRPFKPSVLRGYEADLSRYWLPDFGACRLGDVARGDLQGKVDELVGRGLSGSRIRNITNALRVIYREAEMRDEVQNNNNPTTGLWLPELPEPKNRAIEPTDLAALLEAAPADLRPLWTTLAYTGLRLGEVLALQWQNVKLYEDAPRSMGGWISVERSWDAVEGFVAPKSRSSSRRVPIVAPYLRDVLVDHRKRTQRGDGEFVFGAVGDRPFAQNAVRHRTRKAWEAVNAERAKAEQDALPIVGYHAFRHSCGAMIRAAGFPEADWSEWLGHSRQGITSRYTSPIEVEARAADNTALLAAFIARGDSSTRVAQIDGTAPAPVDDLARSLAEQFAGDPEALDQLLDRVRAELLLAQVAAT